MHKSTIITYFLDSEKQCHKPKCIVFKMLSSFSKLRIIPYVFVVFQEDVQKN